MLASPEIEVLSSGYIWTEGPGWRDAEKALADMQAVYPSLPLDGDREPLAFEIRADADAFIVKGLLAVLLLVYSGRTAQQITATDCTGTFARLGLDKHLSPTRRNGLHSMVKISGDTYHLPPLATVTLESVQEAGEWEVRGLRVQRRLFVVRVSFRERA